jgi:hypothetical protein
MAHRSSNVPNMDSILDDLSFLNRRMGRLQRDILAVCKPRRKGQDSRYTPYRREQTNSKHVPAFFDASNSRRDVYTQRGQEQSISPSQGFIPLPTVEKQELKNSTIQTDTDDQIENYVVDQTQLHETQEYSPSSPSMNPKHFDWA